jgi:NitT/TauT family transport system ATP-binding protein
MSLHALSAAFMPLTDSAILVAAAEFGFAEAEGIHLKLTRETSWANVRDRMAVGHFDVAHMLAPMPIAFNLGLSPLSLKVFAPFVLGLGGNAVTVSTKLNEEMLRLGQVAVVNPAVTGKTLKTVVDVRKQTNLPRLVFAVVHPHSGHNFELRYWLAACGIDPDLDIEIVILPPPLMPDALASGRIDGYCVGEPWNSVAVAAGHGAIAAAKAAIWRSSPEKVLGVNAEWAKHHPEVLAGLLRALYRAAEFCGRSENHYTLAELLAKPQFVGVDNNLIQLALTGQVGISESQKIDGMFLPFARAANFPWQSHALWFYSQMVRAGQIQHSVESAAVAQNSYRPDLYRSALAQLNVPVPQSDMKIEGLMIEQTLPDGILQGPDGFFDNELFDPELLENYLVKQNAEK